MKTIDILGTPYKIFLHSKPEDLPDSSDGAHDPTTKTIKILDITADTEDRSQIQDIVEYKKRILRHELIHAFLFESGLHVETNAEPWAVCEEAIDWLAIQSPKIFDAFKELKCL